MLKPQKERLFLGREDLKMLKSPRVHFQRKLLLRKEMPKQLKPETCKRLPLKMLTIQTPKLFWFST